MHACEIFGNSRYWEVMEEPRRRIPDADDMMIVISYVNWSGHTFLIGASLTLKKACCKVKGVCPGVRVGRDRRESRGPYGRSGIHPPSPAIALP